MEINGKKDFLMLSRLLHSWVLYSQFAHEVCCNCTQLESLNGCNTLMFSMTIMDFLNALPVFKSRVKLKSSEIIICVGHYFFVDLLGCLNYKYTNYIQI